MAIAPRKLSGIITTNEAKKVMATGKPDCDREEIFTFSPLQSMFHIL